MAFDETNDDFAGWFDAEIKEVFGLDVFDYPFDCERGYTIIDQPHIRLLILRTDRLNEVFTDALYDFRQIRVRQQSANIGNKKKYAMAYEEVKKCLVLPEKICRKIYGSRYSRHFFSEQERERLVARYIKN